MFVYNQKDIATYLNVSHLEKHEVAIISIKYEILKIMQNKFVVHIDMNGSTNMVCSFVSCLHKYFCHLQEYLRR